jgi:hypothetical protein
MIPTTMPAFMPASALGGGPWGCLPRLRVVCQPGRASRVTGAVQRGADVPRFRHGARGWPMVEWRIWML